MFAKFFAITFLASAILFGPLCLIGSIYTVINTFNILLHPVKTEALVIKMSGQPIIEYQANGQTIRSQLKFILQSQYKIGIQQIAAGDKINIIYNSKNPSQAKLDSFSGLWIQSIIYGIFGISFTLVFSLPLAIMVKRNFHGF